MGFKCGIVGLPNVGKSTLFNALTKAAIPAENYPFCTIDPNVGVVVVPDPRLDALAAIINPQKIIPTIVEFVDIAGLVKGASQGEGLGNQFLSHIRETQAIIHIVRCFENENIIHVAGKISPIDDISVINTELVLADISTVEKARHRLQKNTKAGNKAAIAEYELLQMIELHLNKSLPARTLVFNAEQQKIVDNLHLLSAKPVLYIANTDEAGFQHENDAIHQVIKTAEQDHAKVVIICAAIESEIAQLDDAEKGEFLQAMGLAEPGLNRLIRAAYELLNFQTFFTAGVKEVRAWTVKKNATAPEAAGEIHTDFQKGFIRAEVISFEDFIKYQGESGARDAGRLRLEGKEYRVQDGDVMHFRFNV